MMFFFEISNPCRLIPVFEKISVMRRIIFLWFSIAYVNAELNQFFTIFQQDGWDTCKNGGERPKDYIIRKSAMNKKRFFRKNYVDILSK